MLTLTLSHELEDDVSRGFAEVQKSVDAEHARNEVLSAERDALAMRPKRQGSRKSALTYSAKCVRFGVSALTSRWRSRRSKNY